MLQRRCGAYDCYLSNKSTIDQLQFNSEEEAFEWIKSNRNTIKPKEGEELSLGYIAQVLDVAGKLKGFNVRGLKTNCGAYDYYTAKQPYFISVIYRLHKSNTSCSADDVKKEFERISRFPTSTAIHQLRKNVIISQMYLNLVLEVSKKDISNIINTLNSADNQINSSRSVSREVINNLHKSYATSVKKLKKKCDKEELSIKDMKTIIRRKRREVKMILKAAENGFDIQKRAYERLARPI
ncbi:MAG: hypothetical protein NZ903_01905 [Candidatus Micrarchaeota archaeon]|nr:hypothetical protein [Candidatus Micrarchaeota archaeon]